MNTLAGRSALITGASQGIGKAIAAELYRRGMKLHLVGRSRARLEAAMRELVSADDPGPEPLLHEADLSDSHDMERLVHAVSAACPSLDVLVHCGGQYARGSWADTPIDDLEQLIRTNLYGPVRLTRGLLPCLERARGDIVFVNSSIVRSPADGAGAYAATKHALKALADSLRAEVNERGVRVVSVFPGRTATPLQRAIHEQEGKRYEPSRLLQPADVAEAIAACLSLAETAEVTDLYLRSRYKT